MSLLKNFKATKVAKLEAGKSYPAKVVGWSARENKNGVQVLLQVRVNGYVSNNIVSYAVYTEVGMSLLNETLTDFGVFKDDTQEIDLEAALNAIIGKDCLLRKSTKDSEFENFTVRVARANAVTEESDDSEDSEDIGF